MLGDTKRGHNVRKRSSRDLKLLEGASSTARLAKHMRKGNGQGESAELD